MAASGGITKFEVNGTETLNIAANGTATFAGTIFCNAGTNISPDSSGNGHIRANFAGYTGYLTGDATAMYLGHNSANRDLVLQTNEIDAIEIDNAQRVGIGINPGIKLDVAATNANAYSLTQLGIQGRFSNLATTDGSAGGIQLRATNSNGASCFQYIHAVGTTTDYKSDLVVTARTGAAVYKENFRVLNGGGITFNGDTAASNALDDYEEGHWDLSGGKCNVDLHDSYDNGWYVKVGHMVTCGAYVQSDETTTETDSLTFTLPFATSAAPVGGDTGWIGSCSLNSFALDASITQSSIAAGDAAAIATIRLNGGHAVGWTSMGKNQFVNGKLMQFTLTYKCQ